MVGKGLQASWRVPGTPAAQESAARHRTNLLRFGSSSVLVTSSYLLLVLWPGAPSSVLAPSSNAS